MEFKVRVKFKRNINDLLRDCGYKLHPRFENSFIRRLSKISFYPRWHLYLKKKGDIYNFSLHLDQKKTSYKGQTAHSGDYDDKIIKEEAKRIINLLVKYNR